MARLTSPGALRWGAVFVVAASLLCGLTGTANAQPLTDAEFRAAEQRLGSQDATVRASTADRLGRVDAARRDAVVPLLRQRLRDDGDWRVRASSGRALGRLAARDSVPDLVRALRDPVVDVRVVAAAALWRLPDPAAVPALLELLRDQDASARQWGVLALGVIRDRRSTRPLIGLLEDPEAEVRLDAIRSLGRLRDANAVAALEAVAGDAERVEAERLEAVDALSLLDGPQKNDALVRLLRHDDASVRTRAAQALGRVGDVLALPPLRERRTQERAASVRAAIGRAMAEIQERGRRGTSGTSGTPLNLPPME